MTAIYFTAMVGQYTMTFWMPQLIRAISGAYSNTTVGALVMVPYLVALIVMIVVGRSSDRKLERHFHSAIPLLLGSFALALLATIAGSTVLLALACWCVVASAINSFFGPFWSLPNEFLSGFSAAAAIALINSIGNLGGFAGPFAMGAINGATGSFRGGLVFAAVCWLISAMLMMVLPKAASAQPDMVPMES